MPMPAAARRSPSIPGSTSTAAGLIEGHNGGDLVIDDTVSNSGAGAVVADGGTVTVGSGGAVAGGTLEITNGGTLDLLNSVDQNVTFVGAGTLLYLTLSGSYSANYNASGGTNGIIGFGSGDAIDLQRHRLLVYAHRRLAAERRGRRADDLQRLDSGRHHKSHWYLQPQRFCARRRRGLKRQHRSHFKTTTITAPAEDNPPASGFATIDDPGTLHSSANGIDDLGVIAGSAALDVNNDTGWEYNGSFSKSRSRALRQRRE